MHASESRTGLARAMDDAAFAAEVARVALLRGTFTLRSGRTSSYYLDKYLLSTQPALLRELGARFAERIEAMEASIGARADRLAGAELGGIPLVTVASLACDRPCVFVRNQKKDYGTARQMEGKLGAGEKVIVLEDVATTGGQSVEAVRVLRDAGAVVLGVVCVIDRLEGARQNIESAGVRFDALLTTRELGIAADGSAAAR